MAAQCVDEHQSQQVLAGRLPAGLTFTPFQIQLLQQPAHNARPIGPSSDHQRGRQKIQKITRPRVSEFHAPAQKGHILALAVDR